MSEILYNSNQHSQPLVTIITPAWNEEQNLPLLHSQICATLDRTDVSWEWIVVDDHSTDGTPQVLRELAAREPRLTVVRFSRNFGSHAAIRCGTKHARGRCAVVLAADLQDPPAVILQLLEPWRRGAKIVWAVRSERPGEAKSGLLFSNLYYRLMRQTEALRDLPATGADFMLLDRIVLDALSDFNERNVSLFALLTWMGFKQDTVYYVKQPRAHGSTGWTLKKKLKLVGDSVTSFSYFPIRLMSYVGFLIACGGFAYAGHVILNALTGNPIAGWSSLMVTVLILGGVQMTMLGVLGEYLWRALDESRGRPGYVVEAASFGRMSADARTDHQVNAGTSTSERADALLVGIG